MPELSVGVIGAGGIATAAHLPAYENHSKTNIRAVADIDEEARKTVASEYSIPETYADGETLIRNSEIDLVSICTPPNTHRDLLLTAIAEHHHIFCEKPFTTSLEDAREIREAVTNNSVKCQLGYSLRFNNNYQKVRQYIKDGLLGDIQHIDIECYVPPPSSAWYYKPSVSGGGIVADRIPHWIDYYSYLLDSEPKLKRSNLECIKTNKAEDYAIIDLQLGDIPVSLSLKWIQQGITTSTTLRNTIVASDGTIEFNRHKLEGNIRGKGFYFKNGDSPTISIGPLFNWWWKTSSDFMTAPMISFLEDLMADRSISGPTVEDGVRIMKLKNKIYRGDQQ